MSTVFEIGGRPIITLNGDWDNTNNNSNNNNFSATSTVVLDPEASGGDWKKQIQVNYRQGQKMRHKIEKGKDSVDKLFDGNTTGTLINTDRALALLKPTTSLNCYLPGSKERDLIAVISPTGQLRKIMVALISVDRQIQTLIKPGRLLTPAVSRIDKNDKRAIGETQSWNSKSLSKTRKINHLSEAKTPECTKKKSMISGISKDSKSEKESSNIHTDRVSACNLSENSAHTLKFDETIKKPAKKKKGKNKLKHNAGHTQVPISKESSEEFSLASSSNETSACGSGCITVRNNDVTTFLKNNTKNACDPELCTSSKGVTADGQLSCKESAPLFQETSAEEFSASTQNGTSNILTESPKTC